MRTHPSFWAGAYLSLSGEGTSPLALHASSKLLKDASSLGSPVVEAHLLFPSAPKRLPEVGRWRGRSVLQLELKSTAGGQLRGEAPAAHCGPPRPPPSTGRKPGAQLSGPRATPAPSPSSRKTLVSPGFLSPQASGRPGGCLPALLFCHLL